ncbi:MAG: RagB/SusD family nutrient uptake outer membrane protein [Odoribacteraceae bacterium]|jgi:hypothetical protein|nr:RagB/SusD family nutrient uptake outer membrane protein [Odoribacteraceae bacterium]
MKKILRHALCLALASILFTACEEWLDVAPSSQVREEEQFQSEAGFQQALLGCYIGMTSDTLYGQALSWYLPDLLSQTYNTFSSSGNNYGFYFQRYSYNSTHSHRMVEAIWERAYNVIANTNNVLKFVEKNKSVLHSINYTLIKGELLAIRAYMHFELLRLYGYGDLAHRADKATRLTIPYVTGTSKEVTEQPTYSEAITNIVNDLKAAIALLELDPITGAHPADFYAMVNTDGFYDHRTSRLNYYAAKALLARVYLWEGGEASLEQARSLAMELIEMNEARGVFSWVVDNMDVSLGLSVECLFSLNHSRLAEKVFDYFLPDFKNTDYGMLYIKESNLMQMYEVAAGGGVDTRYSKWYHVDLAGNALPVKIGSTQAVPTHVSMIRLSELYYIAAEGYGAGAAPDYGKAKQLIRAVREKRGLNADFTCNDAASLHAELRKEYVKEFVAEGVLFYFYKRTGEEVIVNSVGTAIEMDDAKYLFPYPDFEIQSGRVQ